MQSQRGFSLTELITVVAVFSCVSVLSYPAVAGWRATASLRSELMTLRANVMRARLNAIRNNHEVVVQLRSGGYQVFVDDGNGGGVKGDRIRQVGESELVEHSLQDGVTLGDNFPNDRFRFCGRVGNKSGTITLENSDGVRMKLILNITGRIRTEKG